TWSGAQPATGQHTSVVWARRSSSSPVGVYRSRTGPAEDVAWSTTQRPTAPYARSRSSGGPSKVVTARRAAGTSYVVTRAGRRAGTDATGTNATRSPSSSAKNSVGN